MKADVDRHQARVKGGGDDQMFSRERQASAIANISGGRRGDKKPL